MQMKMKSIARRPFRYASAMVAPGAEFSVKSAHVKLLTAMQRAVVVVPVVELTPPKRVADKPRDPVAVKVDEKKSTYKRRDMTAEPALAAPASAPQPTPKPSDE